MAAILGLGTSDELIGRLALRVPGVRFLQRADAVGIDQIAQVPSNELSGLDREQLLGGSVRVDETVLAVEKANPFSHAAEETGMKRRASLELGSHLAAKPHLFGERTVGLAETLPHAAEQSDPESEHQVGRERDQGCAWRGVPGHVKRARQYAINQPDGPRHDEPQPNPEKRRSHRNRKDPRD